MPTPKRIKTLLELANCVRPPMARAAAVEPAKGDYRIRVKRKALADLVKESGIPRRTFIHLSYLTTWENVTVGVASRFLAACGIDISKKKPLRKFLRWHGNKKLCFLTGRQRRKMDEVAKKIMAEAKRE